jgi:hypothetical protein
MTIYEVELPWHTPLIYKWVDMTPIFTDVLHNLIEDGKAWYRVYKKLGENKYGSEWFYKTVVIQFKTEDDAAVFKLTHL